LIKTAPLSCGVFFGKFLVYLDLVLLGVFIKNKYHYLINNILTVAVSLVFDLIMTHIQYMRHYD